jgi:hypothetical protein
MAQRRSPDRSRGWTPRPYHRSGRTLVEKALPYLRERVADPSIPDDALSPVEREARRWRLAVLQDLGGEAALAATKLALLEIVTGSLVLLASVDKYIFELAATDELVSRKHRRVFAVVTDRMTMADRLTRQLQALGLERAARPPVDLKTYLALTAKGASSATSRASSANTDDEPADQPEVPPVSSYVESARQRSPFL